MRGLGVWPSLPPAALVRPARLPLPFPLGEPGCALFAKGRHALYRGAAALGLGPGDEVLVPAYGHGSEVEALVRAGLAPRWYEGDTSLSPVADELESLLGPHTRALHLTHYLGFPQDAARWRRWCDEHGLLLLEDAAQAWLAELPEGPVGSFGDAAIFCLYKTVGVPDGAALVTAAPVAGGRPGGVGAGAAARKLAAWLASRSPVVAGARARRTSGDSFELGDPSAGPSAATLQLLPRVLRPGIAAARRANYLRLLEELGELVPEPFGRVPDGASPFAFPLRTEDKAALLERLERRGIRALDFWSAQHRLLTAGEFPAVARRRETTVCLPVHQELGEAGIEQILRAVLPRARRPVAASVRAETFASLRSDWAALAERTENLFATPDWSELWWEHRGGDGELLLHSLRGADGALRAVLPLYLWRRGPRVARLLGHDAGDQLGPVALPRDRAAAAAALREALVRARCDAFVGEQTAAGEGWAALLGGSVLAREGSPVLDLAGLDWDGYLAARSKNFRDQVRGRERKLARRYELDFRLCDDPARLEDDLTTLFRLHRARWRGAATTFARNERFHRAFAARALERGWLRLWLLELDGVAAAAWYGFRFGRAESYYQAGRLPEHEGDSVGFVLMAHTIREAFATGATEYRLLRGGEEYKRRFSARDGGLETIGVGLTARGDAALLAARSARSGRNAFRALAREARKRGGKRIHMS